MYKILGRRLHYIAAKSKFNWKDRPIAYLRDYRHLVKHLMKFLIKINL